MEDLDFWTKEKCRENALKYKYRSQWSRESSGAYDAALDNDWLEYCCKHMVRPTSVRLKWTKIDCINDAKNYFFRSAWKKESYSAYQAAQVKGWLNICCKHMVYINKPKFYWTLNRCIIDAKKYKTRSEWRKNSKGAYGAAYNNKWLDFCFK